MEMKRIRNPLPGKRLVGLDENGRRCGETHHNSTISDDLVNRIRDMAELDGMGYRRITHELHRQNVRLALGTVRKIVEYKRRASVVRQWKLIDDDTQDDEEGGPSEG
ncbi:MAG: hypothetical protein KDE27_11345 [Planctomycetes bacterium]|nr:hypothetical protein [Planctomycetota bacterium]